MPAPAAPIRLGASEWRAHVDALRRGPEADPAAYRHSEASLARAMTDAAGVLGSFVRSLGQAAFDDAVADAIFGTESRTGLLQELRTSAEPVEFPKAWFLRCLNNRLIDAVRRLGHERAYVAGKRAEAAPARRPHGRDDDPGDEAYASGSTGLATDFDPAAVPIEVQKTFADVASFGAVLLALCDQLPPGHALARPPLETRKAWTKAVKDWSDTAGHLRRDNDLGPDRLRWPGGVNGNDNHARAWQVRYYASVGASEYFDAREFPQDKRSAEGALSYQHLHRFRKTYAACSGFGTEVVDHMARTPLQPVDGTRRRPLPLMWEPARHKTLTLEEK